MITRLTLVLGLLLAAPPLARGELPVSRDLPRSPRPRTHTLGQGETLWTLAVQYGLSVLAIKEANAFEDPDHLPEGTAVHLPGQPAYSLGERDRSEFQPVSFVQAGDASQKLPAPRPIADAPGAGDAKTDETGSPDEDLRVAPVQVSILRGRSRPGSPGSSARAAAAEGVPSPGERIGICPGLRPGPRSLPRAAAADSAASFIWPVDGFVISPFGKRGRRRRHAGLDVKAPRGAGVRAARDGWVVFSGTIRGHGRVIVLEHEGGWHSVYAHNQTNLVSPSRDGDRRIQAGELIARVGASGNATTPHVHFEIRKHEQPVDPMDHLPPQ